MTGLGFQARRHIVVATTTGSIFTLIAVVSAIIMHTHAVLSLLLAAVRTTGGSTS